MPIPAVFFDRDDTLNIDQGYMKDPDKIVLYKGVPEGIYLLREINKFKIIVISNQSGVARGLITEKDVENINNKINDILKKNQTCVDAFYYCPYHPDFSDEKLSRCRKPSPELVFKAAEEYNIDLKKSYFVGDKASDIECGNNAELKTVLIKNYSENKVIKNLNNVEKNATFVAENFLEACNFIITDFTGGNT